MFFFDLQCVHYTFESMSLEMERWLSDKRVGSQPERLKLNPEILYMTHSQLPRNTCCHSESSLSNGDFSKVNFICGMKTAPKPMHLLLVMSLSKYIHTKIQSATSDCYHSQIQHTHIYVHLC